VTELELAAAVLAVGAAALVQSLSGFGFALLAVPLMSLAVDVRLAVVTSTLVSVATTLFNAVRERHEADRVLARTLIVSSLAGMPFGFAAFILLGQRQLKIMLGVIVLVMTLVLVRGVVLSAGSRRQEWASGWLSGFLAVSLSTNGPPLVFLLQGRSVAPAVFRGTISRVFLVSNLTTVTVFLLAGRIGRDALVVVAASSPVVLAASVAGLRIRPRLDAERFRHLVLGLLFLSGAAALVTAL
jgi:uncharacterized membrane protein YfcA